MGSVGLHVTMWTGGIPNWDKFKIAFSGWAGRHLLSTGPATRTLPGSGAASKLWNKHQTWWQDWVRGLGHAQAVHITYAHYNTSFLSLWELLRGPLTCDTTPLSSLSARTTDVPPSTSRGFTLRPRDAPRTTLTDWLKPLWLLSNQVPQHSLYHRRW